jgi:hypothetical protein
MKQNNHSPLKTKPMEMSFPDALQEVIEGRMITKLEWNDPNIFVFLAAS